MKYLLDTCVISEMVARNPEVAVVDWIDSIDPDSAYLSVITIGEIRKGIEKLSQSKRRGTLQSWLNEDVQARFSGRILPIDVGLVLMWGQLTGSLELQGKKMGAIDSLIAAGALYHHCTLVTRNEADFRHAGVNIINPWKES